jgi:hypothetical protein
MYSGSILGGSCEGFSLSSFFIRAGVKVKRQKAQPHPYPPVVCRLPFPTNRQPLRLHVPSVKVQIGARVIFNFRLAVHQYVCMRNAEVF